MHRKTVILSLGNLKKDRLTADHTVNAVIWHDADSAGTEREISEHLRF